MSARNALLNAPPYPVASALATLGSNLRTARLRRNLTIEQVAAKTGTGPRAVADAEKDKPGAAAATYVALLWIYDLLDPVAALADPLADEEGLLLARASRSAPEHATSWTMTSEPGHTQCFVYITLPGHTAPVTAARFTLTRDRAGNTHGQFRYGQSYLARPDCVALDPLELKLSERTYHTTRLRGVFGALRNASPDAWGRRVIERHAGHSTLGEIDYLLHGPDDRAGALGFGLGSQPPAPSRKYNDTLDLARLQQLADTISNDEPLPVADRAAQIEDLMLIGTSMGGARPKAVVENAEGLWIAKFNRPDDRWNHARVEHAVLTLARECGIDAGRSKITSVGGRDVLLVQRFDRRRTDAGYLRARMISALTLLRSDDSPQDRGKWSYPLSQSARFLMPAADARSTLQTMAGKIATWYEHARAAGVSDADCEHIAGAFLYPGLHYPARG